ncbi:hypothetical protein FHU33_0363 [Blastococcus colisei]|uniref:Uncharacterized protein n=1 Tax=Blastococcus colisei TaxID=1564162 RepID=A0A543PA99_9ACTN|nr:hypothetical protein [Blastococcus colisei]TQN41011.1 hypothetical protein FHU33_0363 [Blastococcus colisei]
MPVLELTYPTSVFRLFCGDADQDVALRSMADRLPSDGLSQRRVRRRFDLRRATCRLLDSRILEAAATALNQDVAKPLVAWLGTYQNLREAAAETRGGEGEVVVVLTEPVPFTSVQGSDVAVYVGEDEVASFAFRLELHVELGKTSVAVRDGAIEEVVCTVCCASATFTLEGCPKPLWKPEPVSLPDVHLPVRPPFVVPLGTVPPPRTPAEEPIRRAAGRPPVPGRARPTTG